MVTHAHVNFRWRQNGNSDLPRKKPRFSKIHFALQTDDGLVKDFKKFVYKRVPSQSDSNPTVGLCQLGSNSAVVEADINSKVVVHYVGDHTVFSDFPHGSYRCVALCCEKIA